ncbi:hypothetical protein ACTXT7_013999, partial [Hymenolepis weldensis]
MSGGVLNATKADQMKLKCGRTFRKLLCGNDRVASKRGCACRGPTCSAALIVFIGSAFDSEP